MASWVRGILSPFKMTNLWKLLLGLTVAVLILVVVELGFRVILWAVAPDETERMAQWREHWTPERDPTPIFSPHPYTSYTLNVRDPSCNQDGFMDIERSRTKIPGTFRIACLGGSTTEGNHAWPQRLEEQLDDAFQGRDFEVFNFGVTGWTSAESLVNWVLNAQDYDHDMVIIHHAANDLGAIVRSDFSPDYSHFRKPLALEVTEQEGLRVKQGILYGSDLLFARWSSVYLFLRLRLGGEIPSLYTLGHLTVRAGEGPRPEEATAVLRANLETFARNIETIGITAEARGASVVLTTMPFRVSSAPLSSEDPDSPTWGRRMKTLHLRLEDLAEARGWAFLDLHKIWLSLGPEAEEEFEDDMHLNDQGKQRKADLIASFLEAQGLLAAGPSPAPSLLTP